MKMIYVVTSGSYSDYGINAVYDSRELAEAATAGKSDYEIEEYPLNPGEAEHRQGRSLWHVAMHHDGSVVTTSDFGLMWANPPEDRIFIEQQRIAGSLSFDTEIIDFVFEVYAWARDETHAIKIANERRAEWIASERWAMGVEQMKKTFTHASCKWNLK